ncbi:tRNA (adenosine(37)-N6)-threonylcarbamoyltransferase complex ATPase subunit type 1 TsaE [Flavobacterium sp. IB48]|nr:tRNA (adenosine(37)-N6)-threonylcarbamoyltransferase complex ATPase subunit type 1 TsaE [Flavobacterium sp. IB48]
MWHLKNNSPKFAKFVAKKQTTMNIVFSLDQIQEVAEQIIASNPKKIILFNGEMGVGKTTLIKQLCKSLGVQDATSSPTFSLVNEYKTSSNQTVYHFDFYRLNKETEALDMGVDDYLYSGNWCFIEWSEKIASLIPEEHSTINIELLADGKRELNLV